MKRLFILVYLSSAILVACGDNASNSTTSTDSSTSTNQTSTTDNTANTPPSTENSSASGSFKGVMDKMMNDMHSMQMSGDPDYDFAMMMKQHHQGAIDMANIELSKGTNADLKQVAQKIIDDSQKDNGELDAFMGGHQPSKKSDYSKNQMDKMMKSMNMDMKESGDVDKDFAMMMSMHHQEGIQMAKDYLKVGTTAETKKVANNTIKSNSEDLKKLKAHAGMDMSSSQDMKGHDMKNMDMKKDSAKSDHSQHQ